MTWLREHGRTLAALALLCLVLMARCSVPVAVAAHPPMLLIFEKPATLYAPGGARISIPAGAEIDVCVSMNACPDLPDGCTLDYLLAPAVVRVPELCAERPLFVDGFEGVP